VFQNRTRRTGTRTRGTASLHAGGPRSVVAGGLEGHAPSWPVVWRATLRRGRWSGGPRSVVAAFGSKWPPSVRSSAFGIRDADPGGPWTRGTAPLRSGGPNLGRCQLGSARTASLKPKAPASPLLWPPGALHPPVWLHSAFRFRKAFVGGTSAVGRVVWQGAGPALDSTHRRSVRYSTAHVPTASTTANANSRFPSTADSTRVRRELAAERLLSPRGPSSRPPVPRTDTTARTNGLRQPPPLFQSCLSTLCRVRCALSVGSTGLTVPLEGQRTGLQLTEGVRELIRVSPGIRGS